MSTISDAMKKKRDEEPRPSAETAGPRIVQVQVPRDHTARNIVLAAVLGAIVLAGAVVGGYALLGSMGAFERPRTPELRPPETGQPAAVVETGGQRTGDTTAGDGSTLVEQPPAQPGLPTLEAIFPHPIDPIAMLNGRRVRPGDVVDGYTVVAIEEERVRLERNGEKFDLTLK